MTQTTVLGAAVTAAVMIGTVILFRQGRKKKKHLPIMTFKELYKDNSAMEVII